MKNIKNQDERVLTQRRRIQSDCFQLLIYALLISVVVQQFLLQSPPSQYMFEFLCVIGAGIYTTVRNYSLGNDVSSYISLGVKSIIKNSILGGIVSSIILTILSGEQFDSLLLYFVIFTLGSAGMNYFLYYLNKRKQSEIKKNLDTDENDID